MTQQTQIAVIILAAGQGTRMKSNKPKVMHAIGGKPMVAHVVEAAAALKPERIITVVGTDMEQVEEEVAKAAPAEARLAFVEQTERLGTGHAVKEAMAELEGFGGNVVVLYGDTPLIFPFTLERMIERLRAEVITGVVVLGFRPMDAAEYGRLEVNGNDELTGIVEYKDANDEQRLIGLCNSGVMAMHSDVLRKFIGKIDNNNAKGEYYLTDLVALAKAEGRISSYTEVDDETEVMGVNDRLQLAEAEYALQLRLRANALQNGATLIDPETVFFSTDTRLGRDVIVHPHVVFGAGVIVDSDAEIKSFSHLEGAHVKKGAVVGPYARLRPQAVIGEGARIGNFVEVKKTDVGKGAKINHLSYIGDAEVGEGANIGAGTITCNYDGFSKYKTTIGAESFVGSNSILVAPVNVGKGTIIGAGSVITEDVPDDALAIARAEQKNLAGKGKAFKDKRQAS